jgi:hypothetical protein
MPYIQFKFAPGDTVYYEKNEPWTYIEDAFLSFSVLLFCRRHGFNYYKGERTLWYGECVLLDETEYEARSAELIAQKTTDLNNSIAELGG